jgi:light-regulated signal transduction histidine kinase (bacteriophytochrome)
MLLVDGQVRTSGRVPEAADVPALRQWLARALHADGAGTGGPLLMSDDVAQWRDGASRDGLAGVLAIHIGGGEDWLLLFRAEQVEEVSWAGAPHKALVPSDDGVRIAPRKSFATWRETVRGRSVAWSEGDRRGAERLHRVLHEQRRRSMAQALQLEALEAQAQRQLLRDQKQRLDDIAALVEGMVHLDTDATRRLAARITRLEADLRRAMLAADSGPGADAAPRPAIA